MWTDRKMAEILTVMNHFRRLKSTVRWTQAVARLDKKSIALLRPAFDVYRVPFSSVAWLELGPDTTVTTPNLGSRAEPFEQFLF